MAQKRPPLPIFNKNKRPRQALVAHPNNAPGQGVSNIRQGSYRQPSSSNTGTPYTGHSHSSLARNGSYGYQHQATAAGQENRAPATSHYTNSYYNSSYWPTRQRESASYHYGATSDLPSQPSINPRQFVRQHVNQDQTAQLLPNTGSAASVAAATGMAKEPSRDMAAQHSINIRPDNASSRQSFKHFKPSLRILTATAQGMKHWSQYKRHTPLLFEVFGRLTSPTTLVRDQTRCKQFQLSTVDGPVQCIYWEMGACLPPLVQGRTLRVVGQWDGLNEVLQCYSVREAVSGEEEVAAGNAVQASDRSMRQFVAQLNN